jgi:hypothetical protein
VQRFGAPAFSRPRTSKTSSVLSASLVVHVNFGVSNCEFYSVTQNPPRRFYALAVFTITVAVRWLKLPLLPCCSWPLQRFLNPRPSSGLHFFNHPHGFPLDEPSSTIRRSRTLNRLPPDDPIARTKGFLPAYTNSFSGSLTVSPASGVSGGTFNPLSRPPSGSSPALGFSGSDPLAYASVSPPQLKPSAAFDLLPWSFPLHDHCPSVSRSIAAPALFQSFDGFPAIKSLALTWRFTAKQ